MRKYFARFEVPAGKVKEILDRLAAAQDEIYRCYRELEDLGVVKITEEEAASGN